MCTLPDCFPDMQAAAWAGRMVSPQPCQHQVLSKKQFGAQLVKQAAAASLEVHSPNPVHE